MPAKLIIILDKSPQTGRYHCALWADVPVARQPFYARPLAVSAWTGASTAENTAIALGQVVEQVLDVQVSDGATVGQLRPELILQQARFQAEITAVNPWLRYGSFFDGTSWTVAGAA